jgi:4-carboxymuconolactone decarboxylase
MRLPLLPPSELNTEQKALYEDMKKGITAKFNAFETTRDDGALMGPWNAWLHEPEAGSAIWNLTKALSQCKILSDKIHQIAILVVGTRFGAAYEIYAHDAIAKKDGIGEQFISTLISGSRPEKMTDEEGCAYDVAFALANGRVLPEPTYRRAVNLFTQKGVHELISLVGLYCLVSVTLNGFNVPVPENQC